MVWLLRIFFIIFFLPSIVHAQASNYYTKKQALEYLFPNSEKVIFEEKTLSAEQILRIQSILKNKDEIQSRWIIYMGKTKDKVDGFAIIDNINGKEEPITFAVSIDTNGVVREVEILVYRESHGGEVKNKAFREQFKGKTLADPIRNKQDIRNISGATISSTNIAFGVKRALAIWNELYKGTP